MVQGKTRIPFLATGETDIIWTLIHPELDKLMLFGQQLMSSFAYITGVFSQTSISNGGWV